MSNIYIENFKKKLETTENKIYLIENEIKSIEHYVTSSDELNNNNPFFLRKKSRFSVFDTSELPSKDVFNKSFYEYNTGEEITPISNLINPEEYKKIVVEFSEYYKWLKNELNKNQNKPSKKVSIPHKQKMLILYYLGLTVSEQDNTKVAKILSQVLELSEENTRRYLSWVQFGKNDVRTEKNLKATKTLFNTIGLNEIANEIQEDIDNLK